MQVHDWMSPDPMSIAPAETAAHAGHVMSTYGIRHLPVVLHDRVVGMISDRDVRSAPTGASVARAMSSPAQVIRADATIDEASRLLLSRRISALPVVDVTGAMVGMITTTDCLLASLSVGAGSRSF
jgi:acetoin utilization protein AcuB